MIFLISRAVISRSVMTVVGSILILFSPVGFAADLEDSMRAALKNSASLEATRQSWIAARENIGTNALTTDWSAIGNLAGTQSLSDTATSGSFEDSTSAVASITLSKNLYDGGQEREGTKLDLITLRAKTAHYDSAEQKVLMSAIEAHLAVEEQQLTAERIDGRPRCWWWHGRPRRRGRWRGE